MPRQKPSKRVKRAATHLASATSLVLAMYFFYRAKTALGVVALSVSLLFALGAGPGKALVDNAFGALYVAASVAYYTLEALLAPTSKTTT